MTNNNDTLFSRATTNRWRKTSRSLIVILTDDTLEPNHVRRERSTMIDLYGRDDQFKAVLDFVEGNTDELTIRKKDVVA